MRDRQVFETFKLSNGMMVYYYPEEIGFATVRISLPVGHVNTGTDSIHNGAAHFLEHRITCRSKLFPVNHEFWDSVKTSGADLKAVTDLANTSIYFTASTPKTMDIFRGIMSHVFEPIIEDADLPQERLVLSNERKRLRWYPGTSELSHYMNTEWYDGQSLSLQQLFGSDEDLEAIDEAHLKKLHQHYFSKKAYVIAGGTIDIDQLMREIENIPTSDAELPENYNYRKWVRKEFHEKAFRDVARYQYRLYAFFQGLPERNILAAIKFICIYLHNTAHGPLYKWIRNTLGVYETDFSIQANKKEYDWIMLFPMSTRAQVDIVRAEWWDRAHQALQDQQRIHTEVERQKELGTRDYQKISKILNGGNGDIKIFGKIYSQAEMRVLLEQCRDVKFLNDVFEKYFAPEHVGEFCAVPES